MHGVTGHLRLAACSLTAWQQLLPLLVIGERVHIGQGCVMGFGDVELRVVDRRCGMSCDGDNGDTARGTNKADS